MDQIPAVTQIFEQSSGKGSSTTEDVVIDAIVSVAPVSPTLRKRLSAFLKSLFLRCTHTSAVQVAHPPTPPLKHVLVTEPVVVDELPPLEPCPEKV